MPSRFTMVAAAHLLLIKENKVLLSRRFNTGYEDGNFSVPAGHVEESESCVDAMIREAGEEVGLKLKPADLTFAHVMHRKTDRESMDFFFICTSWKGTPQIKEPDKCDLIEWHSLNSLPVNTIPYISKAIGHILKQVKYSELGF